MEIGNCRASNSHEVEVSQASDLEDQHVSEFHNLRLHYLAFKDSIIEKGRTAVEELTDFSTIISKMEKLHQQVKRPREQISDAEALLNITNTIFLKLKNSQHGDRISRFISNLVEQYEHKIDPKEGQLCVSWRKLGVDTSHVFRKAPGMSTMIGLKYAKPAIRKPAIQRKSRRAVKIFCPDEAEESVCETKSDHTEKIVASMFDVLKKRKAIQLEKLIVNRNSFSQTVENIFALSFLIRDGRTEIAVKDNGAHLVVPRNAPSAAAIANGSVSYNHFVLRFDYRDWQLMIGRVNNGEEAMTHRTS